VPKVDASGFFDVGVVAGLGMGVVDVVFVTFDVTLLGAVVVTVTLGDGTGLW